MKNKNLKLYNLYVSIFCAIGVFVSSRNIIFSIIVAIAIFMYFTFLAPCLKNLKSKAIINSAKKVRIEQDLIDTNALALQVYKKTFLTSVIAKIALIALCIAFLLIFRNTSSAILITLGLILAAVAVINFISLFNSFLGKNKDLEFINKTLNENKLDL